MDKNKRQNTMDHQRGSASGINRREMVRRLMVAGGAGIAMPGIAEGLPMDMSQTKKDSSANSSSADADTVWTPEFLDQHQSDTLEILAERIIPGSSKAEVNRFIDLLLSVDTEETKRAFLESLSAFDGEALKRFSRPFKDLSEAQQNEILTSASTAERSHAVEDEPRQITMRDHFENLKSWVAKAYYSSEIGMRELGWTGQVFFTSFPGCQDSNDHHT
ncbi:MAG TPA: gluconate 2-dehydrogenase subunit 3 family protein [Terriglobia bacterium]|jgi:hypothetical protein|nr:gluconate 2-dehydrogenase subunit 3 family protein [Terriglobia bacterium]